MNDSQAPEIRACPSCEYDLAGLPDEHTCPECGFEYDPDAVVIHLPGKAPAVGNLLGVGILALLVIQQIMRVTTGGDSYSDAFTFIMLVLCVATILCEFLGYVAGKHRFILNRNGVRVEHPDVTNETVRWSDIRRAKYSWVWGSLHLLGQDGRVLREFTMAQLGRGKTGRKCAKLINDQLPFRTADREP